MVVLVSLQIVLLSLQDYELCENSDLALWFISEYPALSAKPGMDEAFHNYFFKEMKGEKEGRMEGEKEERIHCLFPSCL